MERLSTIALGVCFIVAAMAMTVPSVKRGYFIGKHGQHQVRGEFAYNILCVMMFGIMICGGAFVFAGLTLSREQLLKGPLNPDLKKNKLS